MDSNLLRDYLTRGFVLVRAIGKKPIDPGWTTRGCTLQEALAHLARGPDAQIGIVVPPGVVVADFDEEDNLAWWAKVKDWYPDAAVCRTVHGVHVWFRVPSVPLSANSACVARCGIKWTVRLGGKNYVIVPPTSGREWIQPLPADLQDLPELPEELLPAPKAGDPATSAPNGDIEATLSHIAAAIAAEWKPGDGRGNQWELGLCGIGIKIGATDEQILAALQVAFGAHFDESRSRTVIAASRAKGEKVIAWSAFHNAPKAILSVLPSRPQTEKKGEKKKASEDLLEVAREVSAYYADRLIIFHPPETPKEWPVFAWWEDSGHIRPVDAAMLSGLIQKVTGQTLSTAEITQTAWFMASDSDGVRYRGDKVRNRGVAFKNCWVDFETGETASGRPDRPCRFFVPRSIFFESLPAFEEIPVVKEVFSATGISPLDLLDLGARAISPYPPEIFALFAGPGGTGKSTITGLLAIIIGDDNVARPSQRAFAEAEILRGIASLENKLLAVIDDVDGDILGDFGATIKELATSEKITGRKVYASPTTFLNSAIIIAATNAVLRRVDHSTGFYDRCRVHVLGKRLRFTKNEIVDVVEAWAKREDELSAILSWFVLGALQRRIKKMWPKRQNPEEAREILDAICSSECAFVWESLEASSEDMVTWEEIEGLWQHEKHVRKEKMLAAAKITFGISESEIASKGYRGIPCVRFRVGTGGEECSEKQTGSLWEIAKNMEKILKKEKKS